MNKKEFIDWLIVKYMSNAEQRQAEIAVKDFELTIPADIDFDFLRVSILTNYDKRTMPDYKFMQQYFRKKTTSNNFKNPIYWTIWAKTKYGVYEFAEELSVKVEDAKETIKKRGFEYIKDNKDEVLKSIYGT